MSNTQKTLLLCLAVSDLGVGLWIQPLYTALLINWLQRNGPDDSTFSAFTVSRILFTLASFFSVIAIGVDRFLAIHLHLRYQELVTRKRVVAVVVLIWVLGGFISLADLWIPVIASAIVAITLAACFVTTTIIYYKIYFAVRRHRNQIQALLLQQIAQHGNTAHAASAARLRKSAVCTFYVYLMFMLCYLPRYCFFVKLFSEPDNALEVVSLYTFTLMLHNSSLNPVIYCWNMRHIRQATIDILRGLFPRLSSQN